MKILYLDLASNCFPPRGKNAPPWEPHMIRLAAIREDDGKITGRLAALIAPSPRWELCPETQPYHRATQADFDLAGKPPVVVMRALLPLLDGAELLVCHNSKFHVKTLTGGFADAGFPLPALWPSYDTMGGSADLAKVRILSNNSWKPPTLAEAFRYFTGGEMVDCREWAPHAVQQVSAVRLVYHGIVMERA